jgi:hypothetical protein
MSEFRVKYCRIETQGRLAKVFLFFIYVFLKTNANFASCS